MAGSTSGGSMDGMIVIYDCNGDTIWYMDNPGFGNVLYSGPQNATPCPTIPVIPGCMDDDYQEFDPTANVDDGSCTNLHIYGCTNPNAFNYDALATCDDGTCISVVYGCTDPNACNYDINSNTDDGSCSYSNDTILNISACDSYTWIDGVTYAFLIIQLLIYYQI